MNIFPGPRLFIRLEREGKIFMGAAAGGYTGRAACHSARRTCRATPSALDFFSISPQIFFGFPDFPDFPFVFIDGGVLVPVKNRGELSAAIREVAEALRLLGRGDAVPSACAERGAMDASSMRVADAIEGGFAVLGDCIEAGLRDLADAVRDAAAERERI